MRWMFVVLMMVVCGVLFCKDQPIAPVVVSGPAVIESRLPDGHRSSQEDLAQFAYPTEITGYGEDGEHVKTIEFVPDHMLAAFDGQLLGGDRGEWGGELVFRDKDAVIHRMLEHNVRAIIRMPFGIAVFTGLAHMGMSKGAIYVVAQERGQLPRASLLHGLSGAPSDIKWTVDNDLVFTVQPDIRTKHDFFFPRTPECYLLAKNGALRMFSCALIVSR